MPADIGVITVRNIFRDLRNHSGKMLLLQNYSVKHRSRLNDLSQKLNDKKMLLRFKNDTAKCKNIVAKQNDVIQNYCSKKSIAGINRAFDIFSQLRKKLLQNRQFLLAAELELYALYRATKVGTAELLGLPLRTVENHIVKLESCIDDIDSIQPNRVSDAIREAAFVSNALSAAKIPGVPKSVQTVLDENPSDLLFTISDEDLKRFVRLLLPYTFYDNYDALEAESDLRDIHSNNSKLLMPRCQKQMRLISSCYGYFERLADFVSEYHKQYTRFIRSELRKSPDAVLFERYIASPGKGYPEIADECGVTVYKLRRAVSIYEKEFLQYRKAHSKK